MQSTGEKKIRGIIRRWHYNLTENGLLYSCANSKKCFMVFRQYLSEELTVKMWVYETGNK